MPNVRNSDQKNCEYGHCFAVLGSDFLRDSDFKSCCVNQTVTFACSSTTQFIIKMQIQTEISQSNTNSA